MVGYGDSNPGDSADQDISSEVTEALVEEKGTEKIAESVEDTEVDTEEADTEEDAVIGYIVTSSEFIDVYTWPSLTETGYIVDEVTNGTPIAIIGEVYNETAEKDFYNTKLENGKTGYVLKENVQLAE